jgi:hypothetical protein
MNRLLKQIKAILTTEQNKKLFNQIDYVTQRKHVLFVTAGFYGRGMVFFYVKSRNTGANLLSINSNEVLTFNAQEKVKSAIIQEINTLRENV